MEREDPLERLERLQQEKKNGGNSAKTTAIILAIVAGLLAAALAFVWIQKSALVSDLNVEKEELTVQIVNLQKDYDELHSDYEAINRQLDSSREEISQLVDRIKKTNATNRSKMRQYEKELGTLRTIMRGYIGQIDSLNNLNHQLTLQAAAARKEAAESRRQNAKLSAKVENLSSQVAAGAVIKARGLKLDAYNASGKITDRSSRVVSLLATLSLVENEIAPKGPVRIYLRVFDPSGNLLQDGNKMMFEVDGEQFVATASREVDYEGAEVEMGIYVNNIPAFEKGIYTVEAYTLQSRIGTAELLLR